MSKRLEHRVAIVTGAGGGLGRTHALELARQGARVVINDLGDAAQAVAGEIRAAGGQAMALAGDVTRYADMESLAALAVSTFGRIDILVNNAGILRDRTFAKMSLEDFRLMLDVHVMGAVNATRAVWPRMQAQAYGRIVMTTSSSGLYGNFGQSNYGAAKMALVGLMQTLSLEGAKYNVRVNCLAPSAMTAMTEGLMDEAATAVLTPERVSPGLVALVGDDAPTRMILLAGGGSYECAHITMTQGIYVGDADDQVEALCGQMAQVQAQAGQCVPASGWEQPRHELAKAGANARPTGS
ncbi:SDR family NAD(P)-dependent oxidoreductase [Bordetella sp. BOR01]|uniref:SDR family NAD(P)-dependent oxidoreductase n=1 Tax=Bordetella sp. BOR01 TaxID=2854779 RepID=UPI001C4563F2|nr:SDR family NAD(P)-dependent oxidoreductase [Bordetella sp. BOR01]MBV7482631.1 SDR family NAD(P)-dependent oxidoreductase [Bordetella sp. BOR01]